MPVQGDNSLFFASGIDTEGITKGAKDITGIVANLGAAIGKINPFAALAVGALSAFAVIADAAFDFAAKYEKALLEVRTISVAAQRDFEGLGNDIFSLSEKTLDDPIKLAQAYYQIVSAGYDGAEGLRLLETASKAATAGVTDTLTAADGLTTILNAFQISAEKADQVADAMFKTVELGKTNFAQLSSTLSQAAPLASALGVSYNEVLAAVASLTKQGVPTAQAMTQIRAALIGVNKVLGDGWAEAYTFQEAMAEVARQSGGSTEALQKATGTIEAVGAILGTTGKNAAEAASDLQNLQKATGAADKAFSIMASGQINAMQILKNRIRAVTEGLGNELLEVANKIAAVFIDISDSASFSGQQFLKERTELQNFRLELESTLTPLERRKEIIDELKDKYPAYLQDIRNEGILTQELKFALTDVNDQLLKRFQLEGNKEQASKVALQIGKLEREQAQARLELQQKLRNEESQAAEDRIRFLERQRGRELNEIEKAEALIELGGRQFGDYALALEKIRDPGRELIGLRKEFKELTGQSQELNDSINDFSIDDTSAKLRDAGDKETRTFKEILNDRKKEYEAYEAYKTQIGEEEADKRFALLLQEGKSYKTFLINQLNETQDFAKRQAIALAAATSNLDISKTIQEKSSPVSAPVFQNETEILLKLNEDSIRDVEDRILKAQNALRNTTSQAIRDELSQYIKNEQKKLDAMYNRYDEEKDEIKRLQEIVEGYSLRELAARVKAAREYWNEQKRLRGEDSKEALEALAELRDAQEKLTGEIKTIGAEIAAIFSGIGDIFDKFGNEEMGDLSRQLGEVANAAGQLAAGIVAGDPISIIKGAIDFAKAAITVEIVSDTSKFEASIKKLEQSVEKLDYAISQSIGTDRIENRQEAIDQLRELEKQAKLAEEAEERARKEVRVLGIRVADKGEGSGTDPEKIEQLREQAEEARREVEELNREINELFTGTTASSIVDAIVQGFEEGKRSARDFAGNFEELMRNAMFEALKLKYLEGAVQEFFKDFAEKAESGGGVDAGEIATLRDRFNQLIANSQREFQALDEILRQAGISAVSTGAKQGLVGEIKTVSEETAGVLAGAINGIRVDVAAGLVAAREANFYLSNILSLTRVIVQGNEVRNQRLLNIEKNLA